MLISRNFGENGSVEAPTVLLNSKKLKVHTDGMRWPAQKTRTRTLGWASDVLATTSLTMMKRTPVKKLWKTNGMTVVMMMSTVVK